MDELRHGRSDRDEPRMRSRHGGLDLCGLTKKQLIVVSVTILVALVVIAVTVTAVMLTKNTEKDPVPSSSFSTGGDMLHFLVQSGDISEADGLLASWFHRANKKEEMNKALASDAMILEADVTLEGFGTPNQKPIPIMAHPPDIFSDNTLEQWLDAVTASRKGVKLDFKTLASVGPSLDLLLQKNSSRGINRPVWLNADILQGPNSPDFLLPVNGTAFLQLIHKKFPDVTLSPGWKVAYGPPMFVDTYTRSMVEEMYSIIKDVPQKVTFPAHALLVRSGWQHLSWLLSQSPRFSLTLWQGSIHPNVSDLLFVRDNTHPARVYYDIYEPTLSEFKQAAEQQGRIRRFYPGGNLMDFLCPSHVSESGVSQCNSLDVHWFSVTDRASMLAQLTADSGGMLMVQVSDDRNQPGVLLVSEGSGKSPELFTLQDVLQLLGQNADSRWGLFLRVASLQVLHDALVMLNEAYGDEMLYRPVWVEVEGGQSTENPMDEYVSRVQQLFPHVTLVLAQNRWPPQIPASLTAASQRATIRLNTISLPKNEEEILSVQQELMDRFDLMVVEEGVREGVAGRLKTWASRREHGGNTNLYVVSDGL